MNRRDFLKILGVVAVTPAVISRAVAKVEPVAPIATDQGLTLAKLIRARDLLDSNEVPSEGRDCYYSNRQLAELLTNVDQVDSAMYDEVRALMDGRIQAFMGFEFVHTQLVEKASVGDHIDLFGRKLVRWIADLPIGAWWDGAPEWTIDPAFTRRFDEDWEAISNYYVPGDSGIFRGTTWTCFKP